jgi:hypothetical protein
MFVNNKESEMKKVIYIAFVAVGFFAVSCTKENRVPCAQISDDAPLWKSATAPDVDDSEDASETEPGDITDPNADPDENPKKKNN